VIRTRVSMLTAAIFSVAATGPSIAQQADLPGSVPPIGHGFVLRQWTTSNGMPQNSVNAVLDGRDGRLWVATFGGLARFDGSSFDILDVSRLPELGSNQILSMAQSPRGGVWIVTGAGDLLHLFEDRVVERARLPNRRGLLTDAVRVTRDGRVFVANIGGLQVYADGEWRPLGWQEGLSGTITALEFDSEEQLWVTGPDGLFRLKEDRFQSIPLDPTVAGRRFRSLWPDPKGRVWIGTDSGLAVFLPEPNRVVSARADPVRSEFGSITAIGPGGDGEIWVGGPEGLAQLRTDPSGSRVKVIYTHPLLEGRLVYEVVRDRYGSTWVGTRGAGLLRLRRRRVLYLSEAEGLPGREVHHVIENGRGGVLVSGGCGGLADVSIGGPTVVRRIPLDPPGDCVQSLARDSLGRTWIGLPRQLLRFNAELEEQSRVWEEGEGPTQEGPIAPLVSDSHGGVWFGFGLGGLGHASDSALVLYESGFGLPADRISSMSLDPHGQLWVGQSGTISRIPVRGAEIGDVRVFGAEDGVPPGDIRFIHRGESGDVWVGSYGGGVARCSDDGESFQRITDSHGLPDNSVSALLEDDRGRFWVLGNRGVFVVNGAVFDSVLDGTRARVDAVLLDADDGMPEGNGGSPSAWLDTAGVAWFGTIDGLVAVDTRRFPGDSTIPIPSIGSIRFWEDLWDGGEPIVVKGGDQEISFRFSASNAAIRGGALYRYRLVGQDQAWVYADESGIARYPRVPPGDYTFLVEARTEDGVWSAEPASMEFRVLPIWWQTWWFRWAAGLLGLGLLAAGLLRRVRIAEERTRRLEIAIEERKRAEEKARRQQRELEHVSRIATAGELATSLAHELNQPLMAIVSNAAAGEKLLSNPDIGKDMVREALSEIMSEGRRASEVIRELREFLRRGSVETEIVPVNQLVRDVLLLLRSEIREAGVEVGLDLAGGLPRVDCNRVQLQQVLVNLIMNALDAMRGRDGPRRLIVETRLRAPDVEVSITDTGPGLPEDGIPGLFEAFVTTKSAGMGVGLAISRTLVQAHGGKIRAENHPDGGARFSFTLPPAETGIEGREGDLAGGSDDLPENSVPATAG
jgi:signal transduction histidine kinase/ligand-binding sensor domain-containing protein